jgi:hypothetical protein
LAVERTTCLKYETALLHFVLIKTNNRPKAEIQMAHL